MEGWIKLYRTSLDHWLFTEYRPLTKREAWETILLTVNYEPGRALIKGELIDCQPGQCLLSIDNWASKFVWSAMKVRTFFKLLEKDGMIKTEGLKYTTRLTVCNWDKYQGSITDSKQTDNKLITNRQQTDNKLITTIEESKESKESKEEKEINIPFVVFWDLYNKKVGAKDRCEKKWNRLSDADRQKIIDTLPSFISSIRDPQYQPFPETYLNQRRWNDDITAYRIVSQKNVMP